MWSICYKHYFNFLWCKMARKPTGNPTGRPKVEVNWENFEKLCALHCTSEEIASFLNVHIQTLRERVKEHYGEDFSLVYKRFLDTGKCSLRRDQRAIARKNASMAIWLGKQYLGQKDLFVDQNVNENAVAQFTALMNQLGSLQSARNSSEMSISEAAKS